MKTRLLFVLFMISGFTGFAQVLPIIHMDEKGEWREYQRSVDFSNHKFDSTANFFAAHFDSLADFYRAQFDSSADFYGAQFDSSADFSLAQFHSYAQFMDAQFHSSAFFVGALFDSLAIFSEARFDSIADFYGAQFDSFAKFNDVFVKESIDFTWCQLPYNLDLSGIQLKEGNLDLMNVFINKKYGKCLINLVNADIEKIKLRYSMFELYFPHDVNPDERTNVYEKLLKNQKDYGFTSSYEKLDKEYAEFKYLKSGKYSSIGGWILNMVNKYWWGYGYNKTLIIVNTLLIFVLFSMVNCIFFPWILNIYEVPNIKSLAAAVTAKNVILQRIKIVPIAFFYTGLIFFGLKFSTENLKYKENLIGWRFFNLVYFFVIYISGLVCLGYLANFILST